MNNSVHLLFLAALFTWATSTATAQSLSGHDAYQTVTFTTSGTPEIDIETSGGAIHVAGHDGEDVIVEMVARRGSRTLSPSDTDLSDFDIVIEQNGNRITAKAMRESSLSGFFRSRDNITISFYISAPENSVVEGRTSGGSVSADNLHNSTRLRTSGGSVTAKNSSGTINLRTSGGSVNLDKVSGTITAGTSGGSVTANQLFGTAELTTSGGSIRISESGGKISARTSGGGIRAELLDFTDDVELRTSGGSIRITLPETSGFDLDLTGIRVNTELRNFTGSSERNSIKGKIGAGGPKLTARTSGGSVTLTY
jgi:DUF4097 and DUF4098 domain-containing protein YvlB